MSDMEKDWDYLDENYKESENKVRSFEEIMAECKTLDDFDDDYDNILDSGVSLLKTVEDVKNVRELIAKGKSVKEIAADLKASFESISLATMGCILKCYTPK